MTRGSPSQSASRREYMSAASAVAGSLLAGCSGDTETAATPEPTDIPDLETNTETSGGTYEACLQPTGCVSFEAELETWISYQYGYGDIGVALGKGDGYLATNRPENYPDYFYDEVPGLAFDAGSLKDINGSDLELFYELDPGIIVVHWTIQQSDEEFRAEFIELFEHHPAGSDLTSVDTGRIYRGGTAEQGPIINLFQTELAAQQLFPDIFGDKEQLFSRETLGAAVTDGT